MLLAMLMLFQVPVQMVWNMEYEVTWDHLDAKGELYNHELFTHYVGLESPNERYTAQWDYPNGDKYSIVLTAVDGGYKVAENKGDKNTLLREGKNFYDQYLKLMQGSFANGAPTPVNPAVRRSIAGIPCQKEVINNALIDGKRGSGEYWYPVNPKLRKALGPLDVTIYQRVFGGDQEMLSQQVTKKVRLATWLSVELGK